MTTNDPNDYRVPVLRLGDFFEDEKKVKESEYGDSAVTGFEWSTVPVTTQPAGATVQTNGNVQAVDLTSDDELPEHSTTPDTPEAGVPSIRERAQTSDLALGADERNAIMRPSVTLRTNVTPPTVRDTPHVERAPMIETVGKPNEGIGGRSGVAVSDLAKVIRNAGGSSTTSTNAGTQDSLNLTRKTPTDDLSEIRSTRPPTQTSDDRGHTASIPEPSIHQVEFRPRDAEQSATLSKVHTVPEISPTHIPIRSSDVREPIVPEPPVTQANIEQQRAEPSAPSTSRDISISKDQREHMPDVWGELEANKYPGLTPRERRILTPPRADQKPSSQPLSNDVVIRDPSTDGSIRGRSDTDDPSTPSDIRQANKTERAGSERAAMSEPPDIWDTTPPSLEEIVLRHIPANDRPPQGTENDTTQQSLEAATAQSARSVNEQQVEPPLAPTTPRDGLARTDVHSLQQYLGMLDTAPDVEEAATTIDQTMPVKTMRTLKSDILDGTAFTPPAPEGVEQRSQDVPMKPPRPGSQGGEVDALPSKMRTFKRDVEDAIKERGPSILQTVTMQENARTNEDIHIPGTAKRISPIMFILLGTGIILVLSSVGIGAWLFLSDRPDDAVQPAVIIEKTESVIPYDTESKTRSQIMRDLVKIRESIRSDKGTIVRIIPFKDEAEEGSANPRQIALQTTTFFARIDTDVSDALIRNVADEFFIGTVTEQKNTPFLLFRSRSNDRTLEGMNEWESNIHKDLSPFFTTESSEDTNGSEEVNVAEYKDAMVSNHKVRVRKDTLDRTTIAWMQFDEYIIITENEDALATLLERIRVGSLSLAK